MRQARRTFLVANASKMTWSAPVRLAPVSDFDVWITRPRRRRRWSGAVVMGEQR